jgi:AcrR family transcriptional regulator
MSRTNSRREQYSQATKAALLEAATRRFAEQGFSGTALEDVAADIQATRGAVYHHFAGKAALFEAVYEQLETGAVERVVIAAATAGDPWQAAFVALDTFLDICCDPTYGKIVWQEGPLALGWHRWHEQEEKFAYGLVEQLIGGMIDAGILDPQPLTATTRVTFSILAAAGMALAEADQEDKPRVKGEYAELIQRLISGLRRDQPTLPPGHSGQLSHQQVS